MSQTITLNIVNRMEDRDTVDVLICQHNAAAGIRCNPIAWRVLRGVTAQNNQMVAVPQAFEISVQDVTGHITAAQPAISGQLYGAAASPAGTVLMATATSESVPQSVSVRNLLREGEISAQAYKSGGLAAVRTNVVPGQDAAFEFMEHVYIGLAGKMQEGQMIPEAVASRITTRLNLFGVASADVILSDSEDGPHRPLIRLENIQC